MTVRLSQSLTEQMLGSVAGAGQKSFQEIFNAGTGALVKFYTGIQPADSDMPMPGTHIATATDVLFDDATGDIIYTTVPVPPALGLPAAGANGLSAGCARLMLPLDDNSQDDVNKNWPRVDLSCGTTVGDITFPGQDSIIKDGSSNQWNFLYLQLPRGI